MSTEMSTSQDPYIVINQLITCMLNDTFGSSKSFKAMKITPQGIYGYKTVDIIKEGAVVRLLNEEVISKSSQTGAFDVDILEVFLSYRRRFVICKDSEDGGDNKPYIRLLTFDRKTGCIAPDVESEPNCQSNLYLILKECYFRNSRLGREAINTYGLSEGAKGLDYSARYMLIEDQLSDDVDGFILSLLLGGYTEGSYDIYMKALYAKNSKNVLEKISCIDRTNSTVPKSINFLGLGFSFTRDNLVTSSVKDKLTNRMIKLKLAAPFPTNNKVAKFLDIRKMTKGIVIANDCLPEDILNYVYPSGLEVPCKYSFTGSKDILYLSTDILCTTNTRVQVMSLKAKSNDDGIDHSEAAIENALALPYSTYIIKGLDKCTPAVIEKANKALIFIIDKFDNVYELYQRIVNNKKLTGMINNLEAVINPAMGSYFEIDRAIKNAIICRDEEYIKSIFFTDMIMIDKTPKSFSSYILSLVMGTEGFDNVRISFDRVTLTYIDDTGTKKRSSQVQLSANHFIHLLQALSDHDFYTKLKQQGQDNFMYTSRKGDTYRVLCTRTANVFNLTIKRNIYTTNPTTNYIPDYIKLKDEEGLIFIADNIRKSIFNFNRVIACLTADLAAEENKILLIDNNSAIGINSFNTTCREYINAVSLQSPNSIYNLVSVIKPDIIIYHNIQEKAELTGLLKVVPLVKSVIVSTRLISKRTAELQLLENEGRELYQAYFKTFYEYNQCKCLWENVKESGGEVYEVDSN